MQYIILGGQNPYKNKSMSTLKRIFKQNTHNSFFKALAGFGRSLNRLYENRNHDIYSNGEIIVLKKIARTNPGIIIDAGANVGDYSILANQIMPACKIYAFEPVESTFQHLLSNIKDLKNVVPIKKGLFKENCELAINLFASNEHSSIYDIEGLPIGSDSQQKIELVRGDDFIKDNQIDSIDFLKLDVEGAEYDALLGFENAIKHGAIKAVQFEYGYINISTKKLLVDYYHFFEANGYIVGKIFPKLVEFRKYHFKYEDFIGPNFIAVKKTETELIKMLSNS
jgi:FkbM family methyltransferase